jgi:hypothetical protein
MFGQDERSPLWGLAAGGSLIGGAAYAGIEYKSAFANALKSGGNVAADVSSSIASAPGFSTVRNMSPTAGAVSDTVSSFLQSVSPDISKREAISDIQQFTYQSLMSGKTATHKEALMAVSDIGRQGSALEAYEAAVEKVGMLGGDIGDLEKEIRTMGKHRSVLLGNTAVSQGNIGIGYTSTNFNDLSFQARSRYNELTTNLEQALGKERIDWDFKNVNDFIGGRTVTTPMAKASIGGETFHIPLVDTGYTYGGKAYTARYATRGGYTATGYKMGYSELAEQTIRDAISSSKNNFEMKQKLSQAHQTLIDQMTDRDSSARAAAVWSLPESVAPSGAAARARLLSQEAVAIGGVRDEEIRALLGEGLYPYTSPSAAAKGTLSTQNLATGLYGDLGVFMSAEERPTQFIRGEWGVTAQSKARAKAFRGTFGESFSRLDRKMKGNLYDLIAHGEGISAADPRAYSAPQLTTFYAKPASKKTTFGVGYQSDALNSLLSAEEGAISKSVTGQMEYERVIQKKVTLDRGMRANRELLDALAGKEPGSGLVSFHLPSGQFVGIEKGTGKEIITGADAAISDVVGAQVTDVGEANIFIRERRTLSEEEYWKFFSEENKYMASAADDDRMRKILNAAGLEDRVNVAGQKVEAVFSGKLVGRNRMALLNQQIEATAMFLGQKVDKGIIPSAAVQDFLANPTEALNVKSLISRHAADADYQIQKNLVGLTRKMGFSEFETQMTFGLMDLDIAAKIEKETGFTGFTKMVGESTGAVGLSKLKLGDLATEGGAGRIGSFEATGFRALAMKGEIGERYAAELSRRIIGKGEITAADKMLASAIGEQGFLEKLKLKDLQNITDIAPEELIQSKGRYVDLGQSFKELGGSSKLYIPGTAEAPELMASTIQKGERVQSDAAKSIMSFRSSLGLYAKGKMTGEEVEAAAAAMRNTLAQVSEQQAFAKGKILGSRVLTGLGRTYKKDTDVFRVSAGTAKNMFDELLGRATTEEQVNFLKQQRQLAMEEKVVTGGMWRHPTTGPESFQFVKYKVDKNVADGMVAAPSQFGKLHLQGVDPKTVDVSSMVGFKGDFDRDHFVLSAIADRDTSNRAAKLTEHGAREQYNRYLFNHYAMKDTIEGKMSKSAILDMTSKEALESGYQKLTTAKATTGQVNIALQKLKIGVASAAPEQYRPLAEMFWHLEEAAIGGKHGILETELYQAITHSVNRGGQEGIQNMEAVMRSLMGEKRTISGEIIDSFGNKVAHQINYDPRQWAETAIGSLDAVRDDVNVVMRATNTAKGRANLTLGNIAEQFRARRAGSVDIAQSLMQGTVDDFTTKTTRAMRKGATKANALLSAVKKAKAPLMVGAAAAAGIMLMAPSTSGVLRKPEGAAGGRNMPPEDYGPPNGGPMQPPPAGPNRSPRTYDIGSGNRTSHANIRMRINDLDSSSRDFMASARALSDGSGVRINARDDRSILDPRSLAGKIHERL